MHLMVFLNIVLVLFIVLIMLRVMPIFIVNRSTDDTAVQFGNKTKQEKVATE